MELAGECSAAALFRIPFLPSLEHCLSKTQFNQANCPLLNQATSDCELPALGDPQTRAAPSPPESNSSAGAPPSASGMRKGRGTCPGSRGGPWAGATAAGGCREGEQRNRYPCLSGLSSSDRAARQASRRRWLPGPGVLETLAASPCRGFGRAGLAGAPSAPPPGPEVRRRLCPAAVSAGRSCRSDPLVRVASGPVSSSRPCRGIPARVASVPRAAHPRPEPAGGWRRSGSGSVRGPARFLCWRTLAERGPRTVCTTPATSDD